MDTASILITVFGVLLTALLTALLILMRRASKPKETDAETVQKINDATASQLRELQRDLAGRDEALRGAVNAALRQAEIIKAAFRREAENLGGIAEVKVTEMLRAYRIAEDEPVVGRLRAALSALGRGEPKLVETFGGSDNNQLVKHGIRGIVLASAMELVHTTQEYTEISELAKSAELTLTLMTWEGAP